MDFFKELLESFSRVKGRKLRLLEEETLDPKAEALATQAKADAQGKTMSQVIDSPVQTPKVMQLSSPKLAATSDNVYRESLRSMIHTFGNFYYIDGNGNRLRVKSSHGNTERIAGKKRSITEALGPTP